VVDIDLVWAADAIEHSAQQRLALFDRVAPQVAPRRGKAGRTRNRRPDPAGDHRAGLAVADVCHAAVIGHGDLAIEHDFSPAGHWPPNGSE